MGMAVARDISRRCVHQPLELCVGVVQILIKLWRFPGRGDRGGASQGHPCSSKVSARCQTHSCSRPFSQRLWFWEAASLGVGVHLSTCCSSRVWTLALQMASPADAGGTQMCWRSQWCLCWRGKEGRECSRFNIIHVIQTKYALNRG